LIKEVELGKRPWSPEIEEWISFLLSEEYQVLMMDGPST